ncbi:PepSY-associated TM helix domain-containing protein [Pseudoxanthomonas sp. JBR18]|uniref:PepSY-associated TM helix domain-containing protein n=1 Tax=Pseudoxanthomonas sp. JBR18 TaxID=2969308 RepID=UPI0023062F86|nr:PepSY-associated TM helix domain-containing protein [Pseudoxanthomonas sp. JBR18]WCE06159.1 PepSY-associated TM helix domain-containing protein [Pseudoxanthomonas sp. JBR18]
MKAATLRSFLALHTWVGLIAGMALFIAFYAGAFTVFTHELTQWAPRPAAALRGSAPDPAREMAQAQALVDATARAHPSTREAMFLVLAGEHGPVPRIFHQPPGDRHTYQYQFDAQGHVQTLPQRTGFVDFLYDLHFTAGLPRTLGTYLFGVVSILYGLALVSGVVIYAPVMLKDLFALRAGRNIKRLWQDAHNVIGMLSLPFHVVFAWSGAVLALGLLLLVPFQSLVFDGKLLQVLESDFWMKPHAEAAGVARPTLPVADLVARAQVALPGLEVSSLAYHDTGDANAQIEVYGEVDQRRLNTLGMVALNGATGQVQQVMDPRTMSLGTAMLRGLQALHFGSYGHQPVKWLYFVLGLGGAFLFYSGNLLWIEARRKRRTPQQPVRTQVMARLTLGVCLGCVGGVSALFIAGALLPDAQASLAYYVVFCAMLAWAVLRAPARAGAELLYACAALTALVPVAGWIGTGEHFFAALWNAHWTRFSVGVIALLLAWAYWRMGRAAARRAREGDPNSVWARRPQHEI